MTATAQTGLTSRHGRGNALPCPLRLRPSACSCGPSAARRCRRVRAAGRRLGRCVHDRATSPIRSPTQAMGWLSPVRGEVRFAIELEGRLIGGVGILPPALRRCRARLLARPSVVGSWLRHGGGPGRRAARLQGAGCRASPPRISSTIRHRRRAGQARVRARRRGCIVCAARGYDVEAVTYWLSARQAVHLPPPR